MTIRGGFMNRLQSQEERFRLSALDRRAIQRVWRYVRPYRGRMALAVLAMLTVTATSLLAPYLSKVAIDRYIAQRDLEGLALVSLLYIALNGIYWFAVYWQGYLSAWVGQRVVYAIRRDLFGHVLRQSMAFHEQGLDERIVAFLNIWTKNPDLSGWERIVRRVKEPAGVTTIAIVGKYVGLTESYKSLAEALTHGGIANDCRVELKYVDSESLERHGVGTTFDDVDGILVPGGFGERGSEGKIAAIRHARENKVPFFGICLGMQMAVVEFARSVCNIEEAYSSEFKEDAKMAG